MEFGEEARLDSAALSHPAVFVPPRAHFPGEQRLEIEHILDCCMRCVTAIDLLDERKEIFFCGTAITAYKMPNSTGLFRTCPIRQKRVFDLLNVFISANFMYNLRN